MDRLICAELGFLSVDADRAQLIFIRRARRQPAGTPALTSNLEFTDWPKVFHGESRLVAALVDRLPRRCHLLEFQGESYRFRRSLSNRGGIPQTAADFTCSSRGPDDCQLMPTGRPTRAAKRRP